MAEMILWELSAWFSLISTKLLNFKIICGLRKYCTFKEMHKTQFLVLEFDRFTSMNQSSFAHIAKSSSINYKVVTVSLRKNKKRNPQEKLKSFTQERAFCTSHWIYFLSLIFQGNPGLSPWAAQNFVVAGWVPRQRAAEPSSCAEKAALHFTARTKHTSENWKVRAST